jgi:hypothetical protein
MVISGGSARIKPLGLRRAGSCPAPRATRLHGGEGQQAVGEHGQQYVQLQYPAGFRAHEADAGVELVQQHRRRGDGQDGHAEVLDRLAQARDQQRRDHRPGGERQRVEERQVQARVAEDGLV